VQMKDFIFSLRQRQIWFWEFLLWWYLWFVACAKCTNCSYVSSLYLLNFFGAIGQYPNFNPLQQKRGFYNWNTQNVHTFPLFSFVSWSDSIIPKLL
jgi:hypothetical protein